jgi:hypothetical protein
LKILGIERYAKALAWVARGAWGELSRSRAFVSVERYVSGVRNRDHRNRAGDRNYFSLDALQHELLRGRKL